MEWLRYSTCPKCGNGPLVLEREVAAPNGHVIGAATELKDFQALLRVIPASRPIAESRPTASPDKDVGPQSSKLTTIEGGVERPTEKRATALQGVFIALSFMLGVAVTVAVFVSIGATDDSEHPATVESRDSNQNAFGNKGENAEIKKKQVPSDDAAFARIEKSLREKVSELEIALKEARSREKDLKNQADSSLSDLKRALTELDKEKTNVLEHDAREKALANKIAEIANELELVRFTSTSLQEQLEALPLSVELPTLYGTGAYVTVSYLPVTGSIFVGVNIDQAQHEQATPTSVQLTEVGGSGLGKPIQLRKYESKNLLWWTGIWRAASKEELRSALLFMSATVQLGSKSIPLNVDPPTYRLSSLSQVDGVTIIAHDFVQMSGSLSDVKKIAVTTLVSLDLAKFPNGLTRAVFELRPYDASGKARSDGFSLDAKYDEVKREQYAIYGYLTFEVPVWSPSGLILLSATEPIPKGASRDKQPPLRRTPTPIPAPDSGPSTGSGTQYYEYNDASTPKSYVGLKKGHWIKAVLESGRYVLLEDSSVWEISSLDRVDSMIWLPIDSIDVIAVDEIKGSYKLVNGSDKKIVSATHLGAGPKRSIKALDSTENIIVFDDDSVWEVGISGSTHVVLWSAGHEVRILKDGSRYRIVNLSRRNSCDARCTSR